MQLNKTMCWELIPSEISKLPRCKNHRRCGALIRFEVGNESRRVSSVRFGGHFADEVGTVDEQHVAALGGRTKRHSATNALCGASDHHDLASKSLRAHGVLGAALGVNFS